MRMGLLVVGAFVALPLAWGQQNKQCSDLEGVALDHAKVVHAGLVTRGELDDGRTESLYERRDGSAWCRWSIGLQQDSEINTEVWLPMTGWNGRLRAQGNGGFACVIYLKA